MSDASGEPTCDACGDRIAGDDAPRVRTRVADSRVEYRQFRDDGCHDAWDP